MYRRDKSLNADKSTYKYVQARHRLPVCRKVADVMNFEQTSSVANSGTYLKICTFLDVSAALLYIVHCNQESALISRGNFVFIEIVCVLTSKRRISYNMCTRRILLLSVQGKLCWTC